MSAGSSASSDTTWTCHIHTHTRTQTEAVALAKEKRAEASWKKPQNNKPERPICFIKTRNSWRTFPLFVFHPDFPFALDAELSKANSIKSKTNNKKRVTGSEILAEGREVTTGAWSTRLVPELHSRNAARSDMLGRQPHGKKITRLLWLDGTILFPT